MATGLIGGSCFSPLPKSNGETEMYAFVLERERSGKGSTMSNGEHGDESPTRSGWAISRRRGEKKVEGEWSGVGEAGKEARPAHDKIRRVSSGVPEGRSLSGESCDQSQCITLHPSFLLVFLLKGGIARDPRGEKRSNQLELVDEFSSPRGSAIR